MAISSQAELANRPVESTVGVGVPENKVEVNHEPVNAITTPGAQEHQIGERVVENLKQAGFIDTKKQNVLAGEEAVEVLKRIKESDSGIEVVSEGVGSVFSHLGQTIAEHTKGAEHKYMTDPEKGRGNLISFKRAFERARKKGPQILTNLLHLKNRKAA